MSSSSNMQGPFIFRCAALFRCLRAFRLPGYGKSYVLMLQKQNSLNVVGLISWSRSTMWLCPPLKRL